LIPIPLAPLIGPSEIPDPEGGDKLDNLYPQASLHVINEILARPEYEGIEFFNAGDVPLNATYNIVLIEREMPLIFGMTFLIIGLSLFFVFRSAVGVVGPLFVVAFVWNFILVMVSLGDLISYVEILYCTF
jgi:hypothetical protein